MLDVFDVPVVVQVGTTLVNIAGVGRSEGRYVLELDEDDMQVAVEHLMLDNLTAAKARAAGSADKVAEGSDAQRKLDR